MTELVRIKSISNSGMMKADSISQSEPITSIVVIGYARRLTIAPDGSRITSTEKNILLHLALYFNAQVGTAWPGVETLRKEACVSDRHCRRTLASLEQKKVIQRVAMCRSKGGQTSNEYFFPSLGSPPQTPQAKARRLEIQKVPRTPMTPMTATPGQTHPKLVDAAGRASVTNTATLPGHPRHPIEYLGDSSTDSQVHNASEAIATRKSGATFQPHKDPKNNPDKGKAVLADLGLAQTAWSTAIEKLRSTHGARVLKSYRLRDVSIQSADEDGAGVMHLTLRSPAPEKAEIGIAQFEAAISQALSGFYGRTVKLRVTGIEPVGVPPE